MGHDTSQTVQILHIRSPSTLSAREPSSIPLHSPHHRCVRSAACVLRRDNATVALYLVRAPARPHVPLCPIGHRPLSHHAPAPPPAILPLHQAICPPRHTPSRRPPFPSEWPSQTELCATSRIKLCTSVELRVDEPPIVQAKSRCCAENTCCKCMFQVFQMFQMYVASVLYGCCICCNGCTRML
jgi:hypothetical protein